MRLRKGAAAIEFALTLTFFTFLMFGVVDWGWMFFQRANLSDAVLEGCRQGVAMSQASGPGPAATARRVVISTMRSYGLDPALATITSVTSGSTPREVLVVNVRMPFNAPVGLLPTPTELESEMSMYLELQD